MGKCERCGGRDTWVNPDGKEVLSDFTDYCAVCSKNLCKECMAKGCCGNIPAKSGTERDYEGDK